MPKYRSFTKRVLETAKFAMAIAFVSSTVGCAAFQHHALEPVSSFPDVGTKKSVGLTYKFSATLNDGFVPRDAAVNRQQAQRCLERLQQSDLFASVAEGAIDADLLLEVDVVDVGVADTGKAMMTGYSGYLIPSSATDTFQLTAQVKDTKTGKTTDIALEDGITLRQHLIFLPLFPFKTIGGQMNKCLDKIYDNLALEIQKAGLLI